MIRILIYDIRIINNSSRKDSIKAMDIFKDYKVIRRTKNEKSNN